MSALDLHSITTQIPRVLPISPIFIPKCCSLHLQMSPIGPLTDLRVRVQEGAGSGQTSPLCGVTAIAKCSTPNTASECHGCHVRVSALLILGAKGGHPKHRQKRM